MTKRDTENVTEYITAEVVLHPREKPFKVLQGDEWVTARNVKNYLPAEEMVGKAVSRLRDNNFRILDVGKVSITITARSDLFEKYFRTTLTKKTAPIFGPEISKDMVSFLAPKETTALPPPDDIKHFVEGIVIPEPPTFFMSSDFVSPLSPSPEPPYHHLHPGEDIPMLMRANHLHALGHSGKGVKIAMVDSGFYPSHPYYANRGYKIYTTGSPIAGMNYDLDEHGHGTGIASNALGVAPGVTYVSVKMGTNPTLAFKLAVRQRPNIITNSWGYDIDDRDVLPQSFVPLEMEIASAVANGITVLFAAGNGDKAWPGSMPEVISIGGGYIDEKLQLKASDYASSFDSTIYPGRHVPDVCGLVGPAPKGVYIMMPTQPGSTADNAFAGAQFPDGDETKNNDGWLCASGTSSATPMVAGVVALLIEKDPHLIPDVVKNILQGTARDIDEGISGTGDAAGEGWDPATGYGLVDAFEAWRSLP